jgi:hypothetical protein
LIDPRTNKQPQPKPIVGVKNSTNQVGMMPDTVSSHDRIRNRAYELYEGRGREPGQDQKDWLRAEQEILKRGQ